MIPGVDMNHWTPASVIVVCTALISLIGAIAGGIVSVVQAIKGGHDVANNAVNAVRDSVPSSTVHAMMSNQSPSISATQVTFPNSPENGSSPNIVQETLEHGQGT